MSDLRDKVERLVRQVVMEKMAAGAPGLPTADALHPLRRPMVAANWKMNLTVAATSRFATAFDPHPESGVEVVICPPHLLLQALVQALGPASGVRVGAQNCHAAPQGAYTGEHGAEMIRDAGADYVILGHSERRTLFGEDDAAVAGKVGAALRAGLRPIVCVGERLAEREARATFRVLRQQIMGSLAGLRPPIPDPAVVVVAYEPVWAIGTGRTASRDQAQEAMAFIRQCLAEQFNWTWAERVRLLYGGSANEDNAAGLAAQADVDGFLVGGASLQPQKLSAMVERAGPVWAARSKGGQRA